MLPLQHPAAFKPAYLSSLWFSFYKLSLSLQSVTAFVRVTVFVRPVSSSNRQVKLHQQVKLLLNSKYYLLNNNRLFCPSCVSIVELKGELWLNSAACWLQRRSTNWGNMETSIQHESLQKTTGEFLYLCWWISQRHCSVCEPDLSLFQENVSELQLGLGQNSVQLIKCWWQLYYNR